jgi:hypothetical protein
MGSIPIRACTLSDEQLEAVKGLMKRASKDLYWGWLDPHSNDSYKEPFEVELIVDRARKLAKPKAMIEHIIKGDCINEVEPEKIAKIKVYDEKIFVAMIVDKLITLDQVCSARIESDGTITLGEATFKFPDGQERTLTIVLDLREMNPKNDMYTCFADGTHIP